MMQADAAAEMLRLWLKPRMGIQKVPSEPASTSGLTPSRSLPKLGGGGLLLRAGLRRRLHAQLVRPAGDEHTPSGSTLADVDAGSRFDVITPHSVPPNRCRR